MPVQYFIDVCVWFVFHRAIIKSIVPLMKIKPKRKGKKHISNTK